MFNVSAVCVTLFLGGWRSTILSLFWEGANSGWWPMLWFIGKVWAVMFFMIWTRGTLVRIRYDHFMKLGWKVLIPVSLVWFVLVAVVRAFRTFSGASVQALLLPMAVVFCLIMLILFLVPDKEDQEELYDDEDEYDDGDDVEIMSADDDHVAFLEGFPVPPLPGESLPPSPRARRAALAADVDDSEDRSVTAVGLLDRVDREEDDATDSAESPDSAGADEAAAPPRAGADSATALPTFTLDLKADSASDKATDKAAEAPQEGKDD